MNPRLSISQDIRQRLAAVRAKGLGIEIAAQSLLFFALAGTLGVTMLLLEMLLELGSSGRTVMVLLYLAVLVSFIARFVARPVLQRFGILAPPSDFQLASHVGNFFPTIRDRLLNLLQLHEEASAGTRYSPELIDASFEDFASELQHNDFLQSVDRSPVHRSGKVLLFSAMTILVPAVFAPSSVGNALNRLLHYSRDFVPEARFRFEIVPGNKEIVKGQSVPVTVRVHAIDRPVQRASLQLRWRPEGQAQFEEERLVADSLGTYTTTLPALRLSTEYYAEYLNEESSRFLLTVVDRPVIRSLRVRLDYPAYSRLSPLIQDEFVGDVTALAGTRMTVTGTASKPLHSGRVVFGEDSSLSLVIRNQQFTARFPVKNETPYKIEVTDPGDLRNVDPVTYRIKVVPDESPKIELLRPEKIIDIAGIASIPLLVQITDDFGFSSLRLGYRIAQSRYEVISDQFRFLDIPLPDATHTTEDVPFSWDIAPIHLAPEDIVEYFLEVFDNDAVRGPKSARTPLSQLRLPSLQEVFADLDKGHEETIDQIAESVEEARELKEKIESLSEDLKKNKDPDWQQQKKMEETAKRYEELQQKMDEIQKKLDSMVGQMNQQNVLSPETMEKYLELQQMFEQLDSAELQNALKQLQQAMQSVSREKVQQALENVTFSEERFRESIERTLNLLKRIQIEQKLDELKKRAEELVSEQENLAKETDGEKNSDDLAKKQEDLKKKFEEMQKSSADLQQRMEEFFTEMPEEELELANQELEKKQIDEKMSQSAQQMRSGQRQQSKRLQKQIQQELQAFSQQVDQLQQEMLAQQQEYITNALRRATSDLLELSKKQESLKELSKSAPSHSPQLRQNAQEQLNALNDLSNVIQGLNQVAQQSFVITPEMGKAIGEAAARMQGAMKSLDLRSGLMASQEQGKAMGALNQAAMEVQNALQSMMQQSGGQGKGLMGQLQSMAGQQMSINMRTGAEDAARLAVEQEALRKSLEQLNKEAQASADKERVLGDLDRIAEEMKEVVKNLEQNDVNPETIRKQERILSRLLDAARSTRERDFERKRKAQTGTQVARRSPGELDPATLEGRNRLRDDLLKAIEQGYSKDYQELIRKYFEQLQKVDN